MASAATASTSWASVRKSDVFEEGRVTSERGVRAALRPVMRGSESLAYNRGRVMRVDT